MDSRFPKREVKCSQPRRGLELLSPILFPTLRSSSTSSFRVKKKKKKRNKNTKTDKHGSNVLYIDTINNII